jgi:hypothetical protein
MASRLIRHVLGIAAVLSAFAICAALAHADRKETHPIVNAVRTAGPQLVPEDVREWLGDKDAYLALKEMLLREPVSGGDWRNAVDAIGAISGSDADLGTHALASLEKFAKDNCYFASDTLLPGIPTISEAAAAAKAEVPFAIAYLASAATLRRNTEIRVGAERFLFHGKSSHFWADTAWTSDSFGVSELGKEKRNDLLAAHASQAWARLADANGIRRH